MGGGGRGRRDRFWCSVKKEVVEVAEEAAESEVEKKSVIETVEAIHRVDPAKQDINVEQHMPVS